MPELFIKTTQRQRFCDVFSSFYGRTDLRKDVSRAKFREESDFEVRLAVALQKPDQNNEKLILGSKIFVENFFSTSKHEMSGSFPEVSRRSQPCLRGRRPFKVSKCTAFATT